MERKKLGFGFMRSPVVDLNSLDADIDMLTLNKMVGTFIERGFIYFDTAYMYHMGKSEIAIPKYFALYNPEKQSLPAMFSTQKVYYNELREDLWKSLRLYRVQTVRARLPAAYRDHQVFEGRSGDFRGLGALPRSE